MPAIDRSLSGCRYNGTPAATAGPGDCYGPALLSLLEYTTYAHGIKPRPTDGVLLWSDAVSFIYKRRFFNRKIKILPSKKDDFGATRWSQATKLRLPPTSR